ncbi:MAG: hypothetical protein R3F61_02670 [Myxococcota bacterium]
MTDTHALVVETEPPSDRRVASVAASVVTVGVVALVVGPLGLLGGLELAVASVGVTLVVAGFVWLGSRRRTTTVRLDHHGLQWGGQDVLYEAIRSVDRDGGRVRVGSDAHGVLEGHFREEDAEALEAAVRRGIQLAYRREDRPELRRAVQSLVD